MNGNGCAGSTASGVSTGNTCSRKWSCSHSISASESSATSTMAMPASASSRAQLQPARLLRRDQRRDAAADAFELFGGGAPSSDSSVMPAWTWPTSPATRTMKNSSRLLAEIDRKRSRSSSGCAGLPLSSSTRRLNSSHDISRLMKRSGEPSRPADASVPATILGRLATRLVATFAPVPPSPIMAPPARPASARTRHAAHQGKARVPRRAPGRRVARDRRRAARRRAPARRSRRRRAPPSPNAPCSRARRRRRRARGRGCRGP